MILDEQREILFRGKSKTSGRWVYGDAIVNNLYPSGPNIDEYSICPKTLGQYTGINDCNGKDIFEHDIVHCRTYPHFMRDDLEKLLDGVPKEVTGQVVMHKGAWVVKNSRGMCFPLGDVYSVKVLGNVFDDFELLEDGN